MRHSVKEYLLRCIPIVLAATSVMSQHAIASGQSADDKPNILVLLTDDQAFAV